MRESALALCKVLSITTAWQDTLGALSGGNQQKIVLAKWMAAGPSVFLLDDPTRSVDVGAQREIYEQIRMITAAGAAVLFYSSELAEYELTCHPVIVRRRGHMIGELIGNEVTEQRLLHSINVDELGSGVATAAR
jgi:ABC-type sugar transport system ATPase subunit